MSPKKTYFFTILTQKWKLKKFYLITFCETAQICSSTYCYHKTKIKKGGHRTFNRDFFVQLSLPSMSNFLKYSN